MTDSSRFDVLVVGGGAAGLSAALVLARARRSVLVLDEGRPRNAPAAHAHGFLTRDGTPPGEVLAIGREEVERYGGRIEQGRATAAARADGGFRLETADGRSLLARRLLVTTGLSDDLPDLPGLAERWGRDVLHCPYCHGWEVRDRRLGVLATSPRAVHQALLVGQWSGDVTLLLHGTALEENERARLEARGVALVDGEVAAIEAADGRLTGVRLADGRLVERDALFVGPTFRGNHELLDALGAEVESNPFASWVVTDEVGQTTVRGVYAAGNVADPMALLIGAAAAGAKIATVINFDLVEEEVAAALA